MPNDRQLNAVMDIDITQAKKKLVEITKQGNETIRTVKQNGEIISQTITRVTGATATGAIKANTAWTALMSTWTAGVLVAGQLTGIVRGLANSISGLAAATWADEASTKARNAAVLSLAGSSEELIASLDKQVDTYQRLYGISDTATRAIQQQLAEYRLAPHLIEAATKAITAQGISARALTDFLDGTKNSIKGTTIEIGKNATEQERLQRIIDGTSGSFAALEAAADSGKGAADRFREGWGELQEALGSAFNTEGFQSTVNNMAEALFGLAELARNTIRMLNNKETLPLLGQTAKSGGFLDWVNLTVGAGLGMPALTNMGLAGMAGKASQNPQATDTLAAWEAEDKRLRELLKGAGGSGGGGGSNDSGGGSKAKAKQLQQKIELDIWGYASEVWDMFNASGVNDLFQIQDRSDINKDIWSGVNAARPAWFGARGPVGGVGRGGRGSSLPFNMTIAQRVNQLSPSRALWGDLDINGYNPYRVEPFTALQGGKPSSMQLLQSAFGGDALSSILGATIGGGLKGGLISAGSIAGGALGGPLGAIGGGLVGKLFGGIGKLFGGGGHDANRGMTPGKPIYTVAKISNVDELARAANVSRSLMIGGASSNVNWAMTQLAYSAAGGQ